MVIWSGYILWNVIMKDMMDSCGLSIFNADKESNEE